ncbi:M56 family metallopeptidase [Kordiimonas aestuarii]|uniref:M56 family metallopeptidase n=1 Tax=Kordiimonas aestuarii TaxID=1005925 RepID=UPI0021CE1F60|nr:M56 family metallopeptidase [Kordiimonas aestuarii]
MFDFIADMPLVELFIKFIIASTVLMGAVWLAEKIRLINTPDLAELAWKLAIAGSFVALLPVGNWLSGPITIEHTGAAQIVQQLEEGRPLSTMGAHRNIRQHTIPDNDIPVHEFENTAGIGVGTPPSVTITAPTEIRTGEVEILTSATPRETSTRDNTTTKKVTGTEPFMPEADSEETTSTSLLAGVADLSTKQITALLWGLVALMATGALAFAYRLAVKDLGSRTRVDAEHKANQTLREICTQVDIRHVPYLSRSSDIKSPICLPRREICLPDWAFDDLPHEELKSLLAHEIGHMVRRDPLMLMALQMLSRLFFFQPMFILARKRLTDIAELAADEWAAKQLADARAVATALFTCATRIQENRQIQWGLAMAGNKSMLKTRVERLIGAERLPFKNAGIAAKGGLTAGMVVLALGLPSIQFAEAMTAERALGGDWTVESVDADSNWALDSDHSEEPKKLQREMRIAERERKNAERRARKAEIKAALAGEAEQDLDRIEEQLRHHEGGVNGKTLRAMGISNVRGTLKVTDNSFSFTSEDGKERAHSDGDRRSISITHDDDGDVSGNMVWVNNDRVIKAEWDGEFELTDDERSIKRVDDGGELELQTKGDGPRRRIRFESEDGRIETTYWLDGDKTALDRDGEEWVANTLLTLIRETGLNADKRVARILKDDGVKGVLREMDRINSDYVTRIYSSNLVEQANLSEREAMQLVDRLTKLESDYEMRLALTTLMVEEKLSDKVMPKILEAAENIESDYELRLLLSPYLDKFGVNKKTMKTLIALAKRMDSDYEIRLLLSPYFGKTDLDNDMMNELLDVAYQIDSDYEMRLLLSEAVTGKTLSTKNIEKLARIASEQLDSDYETRLFVGAFVEQITQSEDATETLIDKVAHKIDSDYERRLTISMLISHGKMTEKAWLSAIDAAKDIDSDYEKALTLSEVGHMMPKGSEKITNAYNDAVQSIDSDYERERVASVKRARPVPEPRPAPTPRPQKAVEPTGI